MSSWKITVKHGLGRLPLPKLPDPFIRTQRELHGIATLPLDEEATLYLSRLPALHSDPFDRMLVCQALAQGLILLTPDEEITRYPVRTIWQKSCGPWTLPLTFRRFSFPDESPMTIVGDDSFLFPCCPQSFNYHQGSKTIQANLRPSKPDFVFLASFIGNPGFPIPVTLVMFFKK